MPQTKQGILDAIRKIGLNMKNGDGLQLMDLVRELETLDREAAEEEDGEAAIEAAERGWAPNQLPEVRRRHG